MAEHATGAQLERVVSGQRRALRSGDVRARKAARHVSYHWDDDGSLVGSFRLSPEDGARLIQGLEVARTRLPEPDAEVDTTENDAVRACLVCQDAPATVAASCPHLPGVVPWRGERVPAGTPQGGRSVAKSRADALVAMAEQTIAAAEGASDRGDRDEPGGLPGLGADRFQLVIHVPAGTLTKADNSDDDGIDGARIDDGPQLHPTTARRISCGCRYAIQTDDANGNPLHLGRSTRRIRGRLARAVHHRDHGRCQAPGCTNRTTEIHHIWHWANDGPTCLTNLISLCDAHHWLVHEGGWSITGHDRDSWVFRGPNGRTIGSRPKPRAATQPLPHNAAIKADAVTGKWAGEPLNLGVAVHAICRLDSRG
jgi:hypothetical protein